MGCGFKVTKGDPTTSEQGQKTLFPIVPGLSADGSSLDAILHN